MNIKRLTYGLAAVCILAIAAAMLIETYMVKSIEHPCTNEMMQASRLTSDWYNRIGEMKQYKGLHPTDPGVRYWGLIGEDFTPMTTTLGTLEAKETSCNPDFAALILRFMSETGIDSNAVVGVMLSGSFPALAIAALAAIQTIGAEAVIFSSLGASCFGANQGEATWIDMERWLIDYGGLKYSSRLVTPGGENDNGGGMVEEGLAMMEAAAARNGIELYRPTDLNDAIMTKTQIMTEAGVDLIINIGGNQAALGTYPQASLIPTGYHFGLPPGDNPERGILARMAEQNIPYIHLLNIRDLASRYDMPISPARNSGPSVYVYSERQTSSLAVIFALSLTALALVITRLLAGENTNRRPMALTMPAKENSTPSNHNILTAIKSNLEPSHKEEQC
jgi:poly-gamma-glutamate system protein